MLDKLPPNFPPHKGLEQKVSRIRTDMKDSMITVICYLTYIKDAKDDEKLHQYLAEAFEQQPVEPYKDYLKRISSKTTEKEINFYYDKFDSKMGHIQERLMAPDATKQELLDLFNDLEQYTSLDF